MESVTIAGVEHALEVNAFTPFLYAEEFYTERNGKRVHEDIVDGVKEVFESVDANGTPPMLKLLQFLWVFEKTATPKTPRFTTWLKQLPTEVLDLSTKDGWSQVVTQMIFEAFFRTSFNPDVAPAE